MCLSQPSFPKGTTQPILHLKALEYSFVLPAIIRFLSIKVHYIIHTIDKRIKNKKPYLLIRFTS